MGLTLLNYFILILIVQGAGKIITGGIMGSVLGVGLGLFTSMVRFVSTISSE